MEDPTPAYIRRYVKVLSRFCMDSGTPIEHLKPETIVMLHQFYLHMEPRLKNIFINGFVADRGGTIEEIQQQAEKAWEDYRNRVLRQNKPQK